MISEETVFDNDEATRFDESAEHVKGNESTSTVSMTPVENKDKQSRWKKVAVGAGTGIVFGAAATILTSSVIDAPGADGEGSIGDGADNQNPMVDDDISMATCVDDDMSFSQAFEAARAEIGAGGVFEWHGQLYNTYTAEEWEHMSADERAEYSDHFSWSPQSAHSHHTMYGSDTEAVTAEDEVPVLNHETEQQHAGINGEQPAMDMGLGNVSDVPDVEPDIEVLGVVHEADTGMNVGAMVVDGQDVFLIDVDNDQVFDVMASDFNGDGQIQDNEIADISAQNIMVNDFGGVITPDSNLLASNDEPDYINDGDMYEV